MSKSETSWLVGFFNFTLLLQSDGGWSARTLVVGMNFVSSDDIRQFVWLVGFEDVSRYEQEDHEPVLVVPVLRCANVDVNYIRRNYIYNYTTMETVLYSVEKNIPGS